MGSAQPAPPSVDAKDLAGCNPLLRQGPVKSVSCGCRLSCTSASWPVGLCLFPQRCLGSSVSRSLPTFWTSVSPSVYCLGGPFAVVGCNSLPRQGPTTLPSVPERFPFVYRLFLFHCRRFLSALSLWCLLPPAWPVLWAFCVTRPKPLSPSTKPVLSAGADSDEGRNSLLPQGSSSASPVARPSLRRLRVPTYVVAFARRAGSRRVPAVVRPAFFFAGLGACPYLRRRRSVCRCSCCPLWSSQHTPPLLTPCLVELGVVPRLAVGETNETLC